MTPGVTVDRVVAFDSGEERGMGMVRDGRIHPLTKYAHPEFADQITDLFYRDWANDQVDWRTGSGGPRLAEATLLAPIRASAKIMCQVVNYAEHGKEASIAPPSRPFFFLCPGSSVIGANETILAHSQSAALDFEVELAVVIGRAGRNISREVALDHVGALMVANDVSYRDLQFNRGFEDLNLRFGRNWTHGKGLDGSCVLGPWLTMVGSRAEAARPRRLECFVNGELRQSASTDEMIFDVEELISAASQGMTLACGDVILTGTPAGVGLADQRFLAPNDVVRSCIEGLGYAENSVASV
jgi:acylpyruvate hydrolase